MGTQAAPLDGAVSPYPQARGESGEGEADCFAMVPRPFRLLARGSEGQESGRQREAAGWFGLAFWEGMVTAWATIIEGWAVAVGEEHELYGAARVDRALSTSGADLAPGGPDPAAELHDVPARGIP